MKNATASPSMSPVPFHGQTLFVVEKDGQPYAPMRPIVEGMGLAWKPQFEKIKSRADRFCVTMMVTQMPGDDQHREVVCLPLRKLPGWLMTINPSKVAPKLRGNVVLYQNECDDVLWDYWTQGQATNHRMVEAGDDGKAESAAPNHVDHCTETLLTPISRQVLSEDVRHGVALIAAKTGNEGSSYLERKKFYQLAACKAGAMNATRMLNREVAKVLPAVRRQIEIALGEKIDWRPISQDGRYIIEKIEAKPIISEATRPETTRPIPTFKRLEPCGDTVKDYAEEIMVSIEKAGKEFEDFLTKAKRDVESRLTDKIIAQVDDMNGIEKHFLRQSVGDLNHSYREQTFTMMVAGNAVRHVLNSMVRLSEMVDAKTRYVNKTAALPAGRGRPRKSLPA